MIDRDTWKRIEVRLRQAAPYVNGMEFRYRDHVLTVMKEYVAENKCALLIYLDGQIKSEWIANKEHSDPRAAVAKDVWRSRKRALYSRKVIERLEESVGIRRALEMIPRLHDKVLTYYPHFTTAKSLVSHFRKLEGLELMEAIHAE